MPDCGTRMNKEEFMRQVKTWRVPSQKQSDAKETHKEDLERKRKLPLRRRLRAYWAVHGPNYIFCGVVVALILAIGLWQGGIYITNQPARAALGWGVIMAKLNAGAIYPTMVMMLLSMSRPLSTFLRGKSYYLSVSWANHCSLGALD